MCGRYSLVRLEGLKERFKVVRDDMPSLAQLFNLCPTETAPVVIEEDGERRLVPMSFGLVPSWAKDVKIASQTINARAETVAEKPAFRDALRQRRCLVLTDGYFEWKADGKKRQPYRIVMKDGGWFALAGLWDRWKRPDGGELRSFSIVTTNTNGLTAEFHERMPVILEPENEPLWLAPYVNESKTLLPLLKPYPPEPMTLYPVSPLVNSPYNKDPVCVQPLTG